MKNEHKLLIIGGSGLAVVGGLLAIIDRFNREAEAEQVRINARDAHPLTIDAEFEIIDEPRKPLVALDLPTKKPKA